MGLLMIIFQTKKYICLQNCFIFDILLLRTRFISWHHTVIFLPFDDDEKRRIRDCILVFEIDSAESSGGSVYQGFPNEKLHIRLCYLFDS